MNAVVKASISDSKRFDFFPYYLAHDLWMFNEIRSLISMFGFTKTRMNIDFIAVLL